MLVAIFGDVWIRRKLLYQFQQAVTTFRVTSPPRICEMACCGEDNRLRRSNQMIIFHVSRDCRRCVGVCRSVKEEAWGRERRAASSLCLPARPTWVVCTAFRPQPSNFSSFRISQVSDLLSRYSALVLFYRRFSLPSQHRNRKLPLYSQVK